MFEQWPKPAERKEELTNVGIFNRIMDRLPKRSLSMMILAASLFSGHKSAEAVSLEEFTENMKGDSASTSKILEEKGPDTKSGNNFIVTAPKMPSSVEINKNAAEKVEFKKGKTDKGSTKEKSGNYYYNEDPSGNIQERIIGEIK